MDRQTVSATLPTIGMVGALGLFLPGYDKSWQANPNDEDYKTRLRTGEGTYLFWALSLGGLASYAHKSYIPLVLCLSFALFAIGLHEYGLKNGHKDSADR